MPIKGKRELKNIRRPLFLRLRQNFQDRKKKKYGKGPLSPRNEVQILLECVWPRLNRYGEMLHANPSL